MKRSPEPTEAEWNFSSLLEKPSDGYKTKQCFEWEYFREVYQRFPAFQQKVCDWRRDRTPEEGLYGEPDDPLHYLTEEVCTLWFVFCEDWPTKPFSESRIWTPSTIDLGSKYGHGLQINLEEIIKFPPDWDFEPWPAGSVLAYSTDVIVALHINWGRPLGEIKEQFNEWLSWAHKEYAKSPKRAKQGRGNPVSQAQAALKALTALRLLRNRRWKDAANIYSQKVGQDLYSDQAGWINARKIAEQRIKKLGDEWG